MGKLAFVGFPCIVLIVSIIMQGGSLTGQTKPVCYNIGNTACIQNANSVTYNCPLYLPGGVLGQHLNVYSCVVSNNCTNLLPYPAFCFLGAEYIDPGDTLTVSVTQIPNQGLFNFGSIGTDGLITMIGVAVAVAVLAGTNILGSGPNAASIKILFLGGLLTGVFLFLATIEGFIAGSAVSIFSQVNAATTGLILIPFGTVFYILLTMMYVLGVSSFVSGGDAG